MEERRSAQRLRTNISVRWETLKSQGRGSVCDLSASGCFVLTGGEVISGELARLDFLFNEKVTVVWGNIVYSISEMGFAIRFLFAGEKDMRCFAELINSHVSLSHRIDSD